MCGFAGLLNPEKNQSEEWYSHQVTQMADAIRHRGPDDGQIWNDVSNGISFGFRRLSILDLSPNGRQPMQSACGRYVLMLNGEIYNHHELKLEIERSGRFPYLFKGHSDTEVLAAALSVWEFENTLSKLNGMFVLALWDKKLRTLSLARDRMGEKPLFYGWANHVFTFASELKSILALDSVNPVFDRRSLNLFFRHSCIPAPYTPYQNIFKLPPASFITIDGTGEIIKKQKYWDLRNLYRSQGNSFSGTLQEAQDEMRKLLKESVKIRMEADVPLGAFLSGGIDSSVIVSLMQEQSSRPIQTFTIGFEEAGFNEAQYAKKVSEYLGTHHTELTVTSQEAQSVIPLIANMMDEPFSDASLIPCYLVSKLAKQKVTVCLSGDGGDELFGGYDRYLWGQAFWNRFAEVGVNFKKHLAEILESIPPSYWNPIFRSVRGILPRHLRWNTPGEKIQKLIEVLKVETSRELYVALTSHFNPPSEVTLLEEEPPTLISNSSEWPETKEMLNEMMYFDLVSYLPDDILTKMDRATMAVSLEGRMPLLDHRIVEFASSLPTQFKIQGSHTKLILKQILNAYLPESLFERPKMGFSVPIGEWIKGPMRDWAENLLSEKRLKSEGFLKSQVVRRKWHEHLSGKRNWQHQLWDLLMFQEWLNTCK
jgi:asparagine synthase (glutamine-hydrolysing)